nr:VCBS repeat-containing protein [Chloroflexota bacterium]
MKKQTLRVLRVFLSLVVFLSWLFPPPTRQTTIRAENEVKWTLASIGLPTTNPYHGIAFGDINHDGKLDIISGLAEEMGLRVWFGNGAGSWEDNSGNLPTKGKYHGLALGDLNHDGNLDLVAATEDSGVKAWWGDGAKTWTSCSTGLPTSGRYYDVALADFDRDGDLDIVATHGNNGGVLVYYSSGGGREWGLGPVPTRQLTYWGVDAGDLNNDGWPDIVAGWYDPNGGVHVWRNTSGTGWTSALTGLSSIGYTRGVAFGDINHDGKLDIGAASQSSIKVWTGDGLGNWTPAMVGFSRLDSAGIQFGDLNNDGNLDLVASSWENAGIQAWRGNGAGSWSAFPFPTGSGKYFDLALGDMNNDGKLDLAGSNAGGGGVQCWADTGEAEELCSWIKAPWPTSSGDWYGVAVGDVNNDGNLDIAAASRTQGVWIWRGDGGNHWYDMAYYNPPKTGGYLDVAIGDFSRDGYPDLVTGAITVGLRAWIYSLWDPSFSGLPSSGEYRDVAMGDIDNDGLLDLVAASDRSGVRAYKSLSFSGWSPFPAPVSSGSFHSVAVGDVNHDGKLDVLAGSASNGVYVWRGNGGTGWTPWPQPMASGNVYGLAVGDINHDGWLDILAGTNTHGLLLWAGNGGSSWTALPSPDTKAASQYWHVDLGDFNNDGHLDILAAHRTEGVKVWAGDGGRSWSPCMTSLPTSGSYSGAVWGHVDHDGALDIIVGHSDGSGVQVYTAAESAPPSGWRDFQPTNWQTTQQPTCSVKVSDAGSGLKVDTARYAYSKDGGANWSAWQVASCTGSDGTTAEQTITAASVPFNQDSLTTQRNKIKFSIQDMAGNTGYSTVYGVSIDTTPPNNPTSLTSPSHVVSQWNNDNTVQVQWSGASDASSGVSGYSFVWDTSSTTLPDTTVDTYITSTTSSALADGSTHYFHLRTRDLAGNWATGAVHLGPFYIDTTPPQNPTSVSSTTHSPSTWSNQNQVACQWSGASDALSGLGGYSYVWDHSSSTVPDAVTETLGTSTTSSPLADDNDWYFHVRAVDRARNGGTGAKHYGPFYIDTTAPSSAVNALAANQGHASFTVSWTGNAGSGAPIASYDVQYKDGSGAWTDWRMATTSTSATFNGTRGHTYYFRCRARDAAGNLESYPAAADTSTTVGKDVTVRVQDESAANKNGAKVYHNGNYVGATGAGGTIMVPDVLIDDQLAALYKVYEKPSSKDYHDLDGTSDWAWRIYQTNVSIAADGTPQLFEVSNINVEQVLTVRKNQPLVGMHMVVSVEWDASSTYLTDLRQGLENASAYLYDVGDGQFFWEVIEVRDNRSRWADADMRIHASNQVWPCADVWGITGGTDAHIYMGRHFNGNTSNTGDWVFSNGFRTFIHEFGHYGLGLWDEYLDRNGNKTSDAYCATNFNTTPQDRRSSIMYYQYTSTELCSDFDPNHRHRTQTYHDYKTGESTWETVLRRFADSSSPTRWTLRSPVERGAIIPGPNAIAVEDWQQVYVTNFDTDVCAPFTVIVSYPSSGAPVEGADVWIDRLGPDLEQGKTNASGQIVVYGAHDGETVRASKDGASGSMTVDCVPAQAMMMQGMTLMPDPFTLETRIVPLSVQSMRVEVKPSVALAGNPTVSVWQAGAEDAIIVPMSYNAGTGWYSGNAILNPALGTQGYVQIVATNLSAQSVYQTVPFKLEPVPVGDITILSSADDNFRLVLPVGCLNGEPVVSIQQTTTGRDRQGNLRQVGGAYEVQVSTGQYVPNVPATIHMRYHEEHLAGVREETLRIYRWNEATQLWVPIGGAVDPDFNMVSVTGVNQFSVFAILGEETGIPPARKLYLPAVLKQ